MPFTQLPDAEAQCAELAEQIRPYLSPNTMLVGIHSGGAWVARRLKELLGLASEVGVLNISFTGTILSARLASASQADLARSMLRAVR